MQIFRDTPSIRGAPAAVPGLLDHMRERLDQLAEYDDDLAALVNIIVLEPQDTLCALDSALGFALEERLPELMESHSGWYELTYVLSDDGFGLLVYVPDTPDIDPCLRRLCAPTKEEGTA